MSMENRLRQRNTRKSNYLEINMGVSNMKKTLSVILLFCLIVCLVSCGDDKTTQQSGNENVGNQMTDASTDPGALNGEANALTPYSDLYWGTSKEDLLSCFDREPDSEYDNASSHYVVFENVDFLEYTGRFVFQFNDSGLYLVRFVYPLDTEVVDHLMDLYSDEFGEGDKPYENYDLYSWDLDNVSIDLSWGQRDSIMVEFMKPES